MAITEGIKLLICVVLGALLIFCFQQVLEWREGSIQNEQRGRTMEATTGIIGDGQEASEHRHKIEVDVRSGSDQFKQDYQEAKANEPEVADRADRAVPQRVRDAYRSRRLARERSGCAGGECSRRPEDADAVER